MRHRASFIANTLAVITAVAGMFAGCTSSRPAGPESIPSGWPVDPKVASVSSVFGSRRGGSRHQGIDLSAPKGTPVRATADGRVVLAEREGAWGRMVLIENGNGYETRYAHLRRIKVGRDVKVSRGEVIGTVGASGNASGYHLHYEVIQNGVPVDPWPFMGGGSQPP